MAFLGTWVLLVVVAAGAPWSGPEMVPPPRVPPTQEAIEAVIARDRGQLPDCYERARSRDDTVAVGGTVVVKLSIGSSGRVQSVKLVTATLALRGMDRCFRDAISHWAFPRSPRRYRTEFSMVFPAICALTIRSIPWSEVWIDGVDTAKHTPFVDDHAACGEHRLTLRRPDLHIEKTETVILRGGNRFEQRYVLANGK